MAIKIKDTPVLKGEDAKRFSNEIRDNSNRAISKHELERMKANYQTFKKLESAAR